MSSGLPLGLEPSTSYSIHFFTQSVSSFHSTSQPVLLQYQYYIIYSQSFSQLLTWKSIFYLNITHLSDHSHLCSLKCHLIFSIICVIWLCYFCCCSRELEVVRAIIPLSACLEAFASPTFVDDFYSSAVKARTTAKK